MAQKQRKKKYFFLFFIVQVGLDLFFVHFETYKVHFPCMYCLMQSETA